MISKTPKDKEICILSCLQDSGNSHTLHYARSLLAHGFIILLLCPSSSNSVVYEKGIRHISLNTITNHFRHYQMPLCYVFYALFQRSVNCIKAARILINVRPVVVMCSEPDSMALVILLKLFLPIKVVCDVREMFEDRLSAFPKYLQKPLIWGLRFAMKAILSRSDEIIHMNRQRQDLHSYIESAGIVVTYYPRRQDFAWAESWLEKKWKTVDRRWINLVHAGPLRLAYSGNELLRAMDTIVKRGHNIRLIVLGGFANPMHEFEDPQLIRKLINSRNLIVTKQLPFDRVISIYKIADIGINLVKPINQGCYYAQPRKLFEYMAAGLPVIGSNGPTIRDTIERWNCGAIADPTSVENIVNAILVLATNSILRKQCSFSALNAVKEECCWEKQEMFFIQIFSRLLASKD